MKLLSQWVVALVSVSACAMAGAQTSDRADQERRARNREEAMARHQGVRPQSTTAAREETRGSRARQETREAASTVGAKTERAAQNTRSFTHRQLQKVRNFGDRQQRRYPARTNSVTTPNKAAEALGK